MEDRQIRIHDGRKKKESACGNDSLGLSVGLLVRVAAFGIFCVIAVALAFAVMVRGAGPVSVDHALSGKR